MLTQARFMTDPEIEDVAIAAARAIPMPRIEGPDPHDSGAWQSWREAVDNAIAKALRALGCEVETRGGDRTTAEVVATVRTRKGTTHVVRVFVYL